MWGTCSPHWASWVDFSDSEKSFISVAALIAKRRGLWGRGGGGIWHVQFRRKQPRVLNIEESKFQTSHHLYESMIPGIGGGGGEGGGVRISLDGLSRVECIVRLITVLLGLEMDVPGVVRLMCLSFVIGPLSEIAPCQHSDAHCSFLRMRSGSAPR